MKRTIVSLLVFSTVAAFAQDEPVQTGTPALLEAANGKKAKVMLQRMEDGNLTFQPFKSNNEMTVPASKINSLQFFPKYDAEGVEKAFSEGDYSAMLATLEPVMEEFGQYMPVNNNLRGHFAMLLDAYRAQGDLASAKKVADTLLSCEDPKLVRKAKVSLALAEIASGNFERLDELCADIGSDVASLYLNAEKLRAQQQPKEAMKNVTDIIATYGNDLEWMPMTELLSAHLYLDMAMTNSAANAARQVKNMYAGTNISADAAKLQSSLNVEEVESE